MKHKKKVKIGLAIVDNQIIKDFNKRYLKVESETDVISFEVKEDLPDGYFFLGDVMISLDQVKKQAEEFRVSEAEELARIVAHGVLHLLGYEDNTQEKKEKMKVIEDKIVKEIEKK